MKQIEAQGIAASRDGTRINLTCLIAGEKETLSFWRTDVPQAIMMLCAAMGQSAQLGSANVQESFLLPAQDICVEVLPSDQIEVTVMLSPGNRLSFVLEQALAGRLSQAIEQALGHP